MGGKWENVKFVFPTRLPFQLKRSRSYSHSHEASLADPVSESDGIVLFVNFVDIFRVLINGGIQECIKDASYTESGESVG